MKETILVLLDNISYRIANIVSHGDRVLFDAIEADDLVNTLKVLVEETLKPY